MATSRTSPIGTTLTCSNFYNSGSIAYKPARMYYNKYGSTNFWWSQNTPSESSPVWMQFELDIPQSIKVFFISNGGRSNVFVKRIQMVAGNSEDSLEPITDILSLETTVYWSMVFGNKYHPGKVYKYYRLNVIEGQGGVSISDFLMYN